MSKVIYDFTGERYAVTGASSGIGRQVALDLAQAGACVLGLGRNVERLEALRNENPSRIFTASVDVCDTPALEEAIAGFVKAHGKLHGGVHAAGIDALTPLRNLADLGGIDIMGVSFWAGIEFLRLVTSPKYAEQKTSTVLFSSVSALTGDKAKIVYASAKSAVNGAVRSLSQELSAEGHRVNTILPGWTDTPMTRELGQVNDASGVLAGHLLGMGQPEYISQSVLFLLSEDSCELNGSNFVVDGGYSA